MAFIEFGALEPVQTGLTVARTGTSIASTVATTGTSGTVLGLSSLAWAGVGIALAAITVVYNLVKSHQAKVKAKRKMREARKRALYELGKDLIDQVYGMEIPDWSHAHQAWTGYGEYINLGVTFHNWSQGEMKNSAGIAGWLKNRGLEPSRFIGVENTPEGYSLNYIIDFVADPEKYLVGKEALAALGFNESQFQHLSVQYFVRLFDIIMSIPGAFMELQAQMIKTDLEYHLAAAGLDPEKMFGRILPSTTLPPAMYEVTVDPGTKRIVLPLISTELIKPSMIPVREEELLKAGFAPILTIGMVLGAIALFGSGK